MRMDRDESIKASNGGKQVIYLLQSTTQVQEQKRFSSINFEW